MSRVDGTSSAVAASDDAFPPLLLTGGPAAGKSTTARRLAERAGRGAFIDVDDVRQLVRSGGAAPWDGPDWVAQQHLGVRNASALAVNFDAAGFAVTLADVVDATTLKLYRELVPGIAVVRLSIRVDEAQRRARQRPVHLTADEFAMLHRAQVELLAVDTEIDVSDLDPEAQVERVGEFWRSRRASALT